jgi:hypothetical protein
MGLNKQKITTCVVESFKMVLLKDVNVLLKVLKL